MTKKGNVEGRLLKEAVLYVEGLDGLSRLAVKFCWESFCAKPNSQNYLRLFGTEKMADLYGQRGTELSNKTDDEYLYYMLSFYTGDFETVRLASTNPQGSLGWSTSFIQYGLRAILLYLYEDAKMTEAVSEIAGYLDSFRKIRRNIKI